MRPSPSPDCPRIYQEYHRAIQYLIPAAQALIPTRQKIDPSYVNRVLRLTVLAREIVETILDGRQSAGVTLPVLMGPFPVAWVEQDEALKASNPG